MITGTFILTTKVANLAYAESNPNTSRKLRARLTKMTVFSEYFENRGGTVGF